MKKKKLDLNEIKVSSFVTQNKADLKGGINTGTACDPTDATRCFICPPQGTYEKTCDPTDATYCFVCPPYTEGCEK